MKNTFLATSILFFLLLTNTSQSQVSGYMGKRNVVKLGLFMKSSFFMPNKNGESGYFSFNDRYSIEYERVITRNKSIQLRATTFETSYKTWGYEGNETAPLLKMSCKAFGSDFIMYQSSHIAPLGVYASFGFDVIVSTVDVDIDEINEHTYGLTLFSYPKKELTTTHFGLNAKSGVKQILFNCLSIDFNFQIGCIFSENIVGNAQFEDNVEDYLKDRVGNRLWGHYLWGVNCSVGYLF